VRRWHAAVIALFHLLACVVWVRVHACRAAVHCHKQCTAFHAPLSCLTSAAVLLLGQVLLCVMQCWVLLGSCCQPALYPLTLRLSLSIACCNGHCSTGPMQATNWNAYGGEGEWVAASTTSNHTSCSSNCAQLKTPGPPPLCIPNTVGVSHQLTNALSHWYPLQL
jgi:hypothetical protein